MTDYCCYCAAAHARLFWSACPSAGYSNRYAGLLCMTFWMKRLHVELKLQQRLIKYVVKLFSTAHVLSTICDQSLLLCSLCELVSLMSGLEDSDLYLLVCVTEWQLCGKQYVLWRLHTPLSWNKAKGSICRQNHTEISRANQLRPACLLLNGRCVTTSFFKVERVCTVDKIMNCRNAARKANLNVNY